MSTSGTTTFTCGRDEIINAALRTCGVLQEGQTANAQQITDASFSLNLLLKSYATKGWLLWAYTWITVPLVGGDMDYTIGSAPADIVTYRPNRIARGFIRNTVTGFDTPLNMLTRQAYDMTTPKDTPGVPNSFYYDAQILTGGTDIGRGILYTWPVPQDSTYEIILTTQRQIQDINTATQQFDVPQEWLLALKWQLASEVGPEYGVTERSQQRIDQKAEFYLNEVVNYGVAEEDSVTFTPNAQLGR